ncbi:TonB-dependent receptor [Pseudomaricurvus alkylphenolicus]|uniref:TonB-dependent receptor n=1 Tax=Pseudomaricurvus alkylphenolicus TaxID=1306991 RepID=UPI0014218831|nr:TonB-dependent receptor [Pseudomaricurvus alkylphenolicus]NIB40351.1 TonB-dependent receptor [Pseudomaricurvus alkylphenolicus]
MNVTALKPLCRSIAALTAAAALIPTAYAAESSGFDLEEIIVTAQKREQNLQDVGISVTALDSTAMERAGIEDISRIELVTPGVSYGYIGSDAKISIRGANSNNTFADNSSIAGFFVDGVYRPRASQQSQAYFDVERIEILKGPQGTLYGRNTFAGAINLHTNRPDLEEFGGGLKASYSRFSKLTTEGYINAPVSDNFGLRFAFNTKDSDGWIENKGDGEDLGQDESRNFRVSALWAPSDAVEVMFRYTSIKEEGITAGIFAAEGTCQPINESGVTDAYGSLVNCVNPYPETSGNSFFNEPWEVSADVDSKRDNEEDNVTLDISWDINETLSLRSITSYTDWDSAFDTDGDWSNQTGYAYYWDEEVQSVTQEIQLISDGDGALTWTAGLYYSVDDIGFGFSQFRSAPYSNSTYADWQDIETTTEGAFFQAEYDITDTFRIIAGVRNNQEEKDTRTYGASAVDAEGNPLPGVNEDGTDGRPRDIYRYTVREDRSAVREFDLVTWKLGGEWDVADNVMAYASVSTGFLSGGVNADGSAFEQQESKAYEIGFKSRWADDTIQLNVSAYRNEFTNLTTQQLIRLGTGDITITVNGGEIETTGLEAEFVWLPTEKWLISANASFMDNEYGKFGAANPFVEANGEPLGFLDLNGETPPWSPDVTLSLSIGYDIDLGDMGRLTPFLQTYYSDEFNTDDVVTYSTQVQDSYTKTDFRLIWTSADENLSAEAYVENMEDEAVLARTNVGGFDLVQTSYMYPRNYGVKVSYNF